MTLNFLRAVKRPQIFYIPLVTHKNSGHYITNVPMTKSSESAASRHSFTKRLLGQIVGLEQEFR